MNIVVCVKQVPEAGGGRFDPETKRLDRGGAVNVLNPFDRRAIALAVELTRRFAGSSTAITLGPTQAREVLLEALASGIDRAVHLCDPAFAGSDTLATARVLAAAIRRLPHDLVLCGKYTVDGETGQVGPELAELLGLPQVTGARRLAVTSDANGVSRIEAERESDEGYERVETALPALVTAAERLIQPISPTPEALEQARHANIEMWTHRELCLEADAVGQAGSPTVVLDLRDQRIRRPPIHMERGTLDAQAKALARLVEEWNGRNAEIERRRPLPTSPPLANDAAAIWVVVERRADGSPTNGTLELLGEASWLARRLGGFAAAVVFDEELAAPEPLAANGADRVLALNGPAFGGYSAEGRAAALAALLERRRPHAVLFSASERGRDLAPRLAARLGLGLTGDCIGLAIDPDGRLLQMKPALGTGIVAPIWSRTAPQLTTVRPGTFPLPITNPKRALGLERVTLLFEVPRGSILRQAVVEADPSWPRLEGARSVIGVGTGIGGPQALPLIRRFASFFGAAIGATRRVTDRGWLPRLLQIGLTGRMVAPDLYVAIGVRGAPNHTVGIQGARTIVALNVEPMAEIFSTADVGFVADFRPLLERACAILEVGDGAARS